MKTIIKNELIIFLVLLFLLSIGAHNDLLHTPLKRLTLMYDEGNFIHPFLYTLLVYILFGIIRLSITWVKRYKRTSS